MSALIYYPGVEKLTRLAKAGAVDRAADPVEATDPADDDCLGVDGAYPVVQDGKLNRKAVLLSITMAQENDEGEIAEAATQLLGVIDAKEDAKDNRSLILSVPGGRKLAPAVTLGQGYPKEINGQPVEYMWGEPMKTGTYKGVDEEGEPWTLKVDRNRIEGWANTFHAMKDAGVAVPANHDHKEDSKNAAGFVVDAKAEGDTLKLLHQFIGKTAIEAASRNYLSLGIKKNFKDGKGRVWKDAIFHSALTPSPVVPGQKGLITASRGAESSGCIFLSLTAPDEVKPMFTPEQLARARKLLAKPELKDEEAGEACLSLCEKLSTDVGSKVAEVEEGKKQLSLAQAALEAKTAEVVKLSLTDDAPDEDTLSDRVQLATLKIDAKVAERKMLPFQATKLKAQLKKDGKPVTFLLSRAKGLGERPIDVIIDTFTEEIAPKTGEITKGQGHQLLDDPSKTVGEDPKTALLSMMLGMAKGTAAADSMSQTRMVAAE